MCIAYSDIIVKKRKRFIRSIRSMFDPFITYVLRI